MKTIADIIGGAQALLDISFNLQDCFEESLADDQKTFLQVLRVIEDIMPPIIRRKAPTGRPPYPFKPFIRCMFAKSMFGIDVRCPMPGCFEVSSTLHLLSFARGSIYKTNGAIPLKTLRNKPV